MTVTLSLRITIKKYLYRNELLLAPVELTSNVLDRRRFVGSLVLSLLILVFISFLASELFIPFLVFLVLTFIFSYYYFTPTSYLRVENERLSFQNNRIQEVLSYADIDELFYIKELDKSSSRTYERPLSYHLISGKRRYRIDLTRFANERIVEANAILQSHLGDRFVEEIRYRRKVPDSRDQTPTPNRSFIELDLVDPE